MSYLLSRVHALPRQQVINFTPVTINIIQTRNIKRFKKYGAEEGHDNKNEVRKERWIRKQMPNRTGGGDWREEHGLTRNSNNSGPLYDIPDYRFEDGSPGIPSMNQVKTRLQEKLYAQQIKEALDFIKNSQLAVSEHYSQKKQVKDDFLKSKLKQKGKVTYSKN